MATGDTPRELQPEGAERQRLARSGLISFVGAATSALMGFALTFIVARAFGEYGAGIVLQAIAVYSITLGLVRFGMDSVAVWLMPRLQVDGVREIRGALSFMLLVVTGTGVLGGVALAALAPAIAGPDGTQLTAALRLLAWFVPPGALILDPPSGLVGTACCNARMPL